MAAVELYYTSLFGDANIKGYWRLQDNGVDEIQGNNGSAVSTLTYAAAKFDQGTSHDGSGYLTIPNNTNMNLGNVWSVSAWVNPTTVTSGRQGVWSNRNGATTGEWCVETGVGSGGSGRVAVTTVGTYIMETGNGVIAAGSLQHLVVTKNGTGANAFYVYVNGSAVGSGIGSAFTCVDNTLDKKIGGGGGPGNFVGLIDDVAIFNRVLSGTEVSNLYSGGLAYYAHVTQNYLKDRSRNRWDFGGVSLG